MADVKVMVVDDSAAMRALFCDILDNAKGVTVCGVAKNAAEARDKIPELRPDVITLDVEMPGMSGMEFLAEIMGTNPLPVIMLSSITQAGTGTAARALELGAVHCFPKPLHSSGAEYEATIVRLGDIVRRAAAGELVPGGADEAGAGSNAGSAYVSDGSIVVLACGQAGLESAKQVLAAYPADCPPTILVVDGEEDAVAGAVAAMRGSLACEIAEAVDGYEVRPGRALIAYDGARHVIVEAGSPPRVRVVEREAVAGFRPSADLLLGSLARAGVPVVAGVLPGTGADGAKGLQMLASAAGARVFIQRPADYAPRERYDAVRTLSIAAADLDARDVAGWVLQQTAKVAG